MYKKAQNHFKKADVVLHKASLVHKIADIKRSKNVFEDLIRAIASQQLSGKAADTIFGRLEKLVGKNNFTAKRILKIKDSVLRECGFSNAKVVAIKSLAKAVVDKNLNLNNIHLSDDIEVMESLTSVKGIGPWTAEMILMFSLGRTDIFSRGDLGLMKGLMHLYGWKKLPSEKKISSTIEKWSPYKTYAARVLWKIADKKKMRLPRKR